MRGKLRHITFMLLAILMLQGCIHDYPHDGGIDPTMVELRVDLSLNLSWQQFAEAAVFDTRARNEGSHRIVTEIMRKGEVIGRSETYLSDEEFELGKATIPLSFRLHALEYQLAVWYDRNPGNQEEAAYHSDRLSSIEQKNFPLEWTPSLSCGYASCIIDLTPLRGKWGARITKELDLLHSGARFELVTTDFQEFIENQRVALLQGETYSLTISVHSAVADSFDAYSGNSLALKEEKESIKTLTLPFTQSDMVTIADGFLFCEEDDNASMKLIVHNSARAIVVQTPWFRFPVKRGSITRVYGDFLSNFFKGSISIDNIWEGEIEIEV